MLPYLHRANRFQNALSGRRDAPWERRRRARPRHTLPGAVIVPDGRIDSAPTPPHHTPSRAAGATGSAGREFLDRRADGDGAAGDDPGAQAAPIDERLQDRLAGELN